MTTEQSSRSRVRQWVREHVEGEAEIVIPDLVNDAVSAFSKDRKFLTALATETLRDMIYRQAVEEISRSRMFILGDVAVDREGVKQRARKQSAFASWLEHVGDRHVRLMDMTHEDLLAAASEREKRGQHELGIATLWRTLANQLEGGQTVSTKFTAEEIEAMQQGMAHS
jgi:hypothetical protein